MWKCMVNLQMLRGGIVRSVTLCADGVIAHHRIGGPYDVEYRARDLSRFPKGSLLISNPKTQPSSALSQSSGRIFKLGYQPNNPENLFLIDSDIMSSEQSKIQPEWAT